MSSTGRIRKDGMHQEDLVEYTYYLWTQQASILNYMSTLGDMCSEIFRQLSAAGTSYSISITATLKSLEISKKASFPNSISDLTKVSVTLTQV